MRASRVAVELREMPVAARETEFGSSTTSTMVMLGGATIY